MNISSLVLSEKELGGIFFSLFYLLFFSHFFGYIFNKFHLPRVIGEIFGGIILGPSGLGSISPTSYNSLFNSFPEQGKILSFFYWVGLVLLMLTAGFKFRKTPDTKDNNIIFNLIISSTILPILGGITYYYLYDFSPYIGSMGNNLSMSIIVSISIAITSIPVISKIFIDLYIIQSRFAKIVLATATLHDLILWVALDVAIKTSTKTNINIFLGALVSILFLGFSLLIGPSIFKYISKLKSNFLLKSSPIGYILIICLLMILITNFFGINIIFGTLMTGIIIGNLPSDKLQIAKDSIAGFSLAFFIPIYFSIVGLKINLSTSFDLKLFLSFLLISSLLEIGSVVMGLRLMKENWLTCLNFGFAMNTRGGPGIVIATMAYDFSIINEVFFVVLILVAIVTSIISGTWFKYVLKRGWPLYES